MFDQFIAERVSPADLSFEEDWFDPAWLDEAPWLDGVAEPEDTGQIPVSACVPSGWLALELDHATADPARLSDTELIDAVIGFDRLASWALARQAGLLAEFARRRPAEGSPPPGRSDVPARYSGFTPDEIALALRLSRTAATGRLVMARTLAADLPGTLAAWEAGVIDSLKARVITEASYLLPPQLRGALEARVLPRAGEQTIARLRAALTRAVLVLDPDGAEARHQLRRKDRRVVMGPDGEGMASLWALLSAPDATAAYQRLCQLARGLGAGDPRGMDARRADLLVELLTGRRCAATGDCLDQDCPGCTRTGCDPTGCDPTHVTFPDRASVEARAGDDVVDDDLTSDGDLTGDHPADAESGNAQDPAAVADGGCVRNGTGHRCGPGAGPGKPLVSVIVPITTLMGLDELPAELVGYGPIPAPLAREIAAEGTWRRLLTDPASGTLLDYGRTTYTPPTGLADFVRARDLYCRNPICGQRAATADLDHTIPWPEGTTSEDNLYAGCRHDHLVKTHAPGWHVDQHPDGHITWTTPTGHTYTSHPHDYRPDPSGQTRPPPLTGQPPGPPPTGQPPDAGYDPDLDPPPF